MNIQYREKYLKYKVKYLELKQNLDNQDAFGKKEEKKKEKKKIEIMGSINNIIASEISPALIVSLKDIIRDIISSELEIGFIREILEKTKKIWQTKGFNIDYFIEAELQKVSTELDIRYEQDTLRIATLFNDRDNSKMAIIKFPLLQFYFDYLYKAPRESAENKMSVYNNNLKNVSNLTKKEKNKIKILTERIEKLKVIERKLYNIYMMFIYCKEVKYGQAPSLNEFDQSILDNELTQ
jgi:hypothetical protein